MNFPGDGTPLESLLRAVEASVRHGLNITVFLVVGFPDDTWDDINESARLARRLARIGIDDVATGFYFPIPNTEISPDPLAEWRIRLDDEFLMTPIFANDEKCRPENCYSRHLSPRELTRAKYRILLHFYGASLLYHPGKFLRILKHVLQGKEERKLETWLLELKRKGGIWVRDHLPGPRGRARPLARP